MKKIFVLIILLPGWFTGWAQASSRGIIIKNISIIDVQNARIIPNCTIFIKGDRIAKIEYSKSKKITNADTVIDGTGKFILPGFWDMHMHICWKEDMSKLFPVLLKYGITGIRDMGGSAVVLNKFKQQLKNDPQSGPMIFGAGPILDGEKPVHADFSAPLTSGNVRKVLDSLYKEKVDFFKVYSLLPKNIVDSIAGYVKEKKMSFAGHVSEYITPEEAAELGQKSFEHLNRLEDLQTDTGRLSAFIKTAKSMHSWLCPTLVIYQRKSEIARREFFEPAIYKDLDTDLKNEWDLVKKNRQNRIYTEKDSLRTQTRFDDQKKLTRYFYDHGIPFLTGSDFAGMQFIYPGYSLHEEMALLQNIGIPPFDILKIATLNPALFFGLTKNYGSIKKGKMADLVILNENPVADIRNTQRIAMVIKAGKIVPRDSSTQTF